MLTWTNGTSNCRQPERIIVVGHPDVYLDVDYSNDPDLGKRGLSDGRSRFTPPAEGDGVWHITPPKEVIAAMRWEKRLWTAVAVAPDLDQSLIWTVASDVKGCLRDATLFEEGMTVWSDGSTSGFDLFANDSYDSTVLLELPSIAREALALPTKRFVIALYCSNQRLNPTNAIEAFGVRGGLNGVLAEGASPDVSIDSEPFADYPVLNHDGWLLLDVTKSIRQTEQVPEGIALRLKGHQAGIQEQIRFISPQPTDLDDMTKRPVLLVVEDESVETAEGAMEEREDAG